MTTFNRLASQRRSIQTITQPGIDAAWGIASESQSRDTDIIMAVQLYDDTQTGKIALVNALRDAVIGRFGPVTGRTILEMAGE